MYLCVYFAQHIISLCGNCVTTCILYIFTYNSPNRNVVGSLTVMQQGIKSILDFCFTSCCLVQISLFSVTKVVRFCHCVCVYVCICVCMCACARTCLRMCRYNAPVTIHCILTFQCEVKIYF